MINTDEAIKIAERLVSQTEKGYVKWKKLSESAYQVSFTNSSVRIEQHEDSCVLRIINGSGDIIGNFVSKNPKGHIPMLFDIVKRKTNRIDETLKNIWDSIGE